MTSRIEEAAVPSSSLIEYAAIIVQAYVGNNPASASEVAGLIREVHATLAGLAQPGAETPVTTQKPAVPVKKSITPDYMICLEDGKKLKMLKRHLKTAYNMTPESYRERWGLSSDYPMVAPNYARQRSRLAKEIGLGTRARRGRA
jgi:predicted transcriptional regulator